MFRFISLHNTRDKILFIIDFWLTWTSSFPTLKPNITYPSFFEGVILTTTLWSICTSLLSSALLIKSSVFRSSTGLSTPLESCIKEPALKWDGYSSSSWSFESFLVSWAFRREISKNNLQINMLLIIRHVF